jgi:phosphoribosylanthranilate isomerase
MMSKLLVKICGLSTPESVDWALDAGADLVGFVHFPRSPRHVSIETAAALASRVAGRAKTVVLTVDPTDELVRDLVAGIAPDYVQLHGKESPERVVAVRALTSRPVIKALGIGSADDAAGAFAYRDAADLLLYDAKPPKGANRPGGLGVAFDWSLLTGAPTPFLLSGGLDPTNVADAVRRVRPFGVDVSSGVESAPGVKDEVRIRTFVTAARAANGDGEQ